MLYRFARRNYDALNFVLGGTSISLATKGTSGASVATEDGVPLNPKRLQNRCGSSAMRYPSIAVSRVSRSSAPNAPAKLETIRPARSRSTCSIKLLVRAAKVCETVARGNKGNNRHTEEPIAPVHFRSHLSFALDSSMVCHCMLEGSSAPPLASGTM